MSEGVCINHRTGQPRRDENIDVGDLVMTVDALYVVETVTRYKEREEPDGELKECIAFTLFKVKTIVPSEA